MPQDRVDPTGKTLPAHVATAWGQRVHVDRTYFSYFLPGIGTVGARYSFAPERFSASGEDLPSSVVVGSDMAARVMGFGKSGDLLWNFAGDGRNILIDGDLLYTSVDGLIFRHSIALRETLDVIDLGGSPLFLKRSGDFVILAVSDRSDPNVQRLRVFDGRETDWHKHELFSLPLQAGSYPRDAEISGGHLIVANTFAHNVSVIDLATGATVFRESLYFPNEIEIVSPGSFLVTEEHANRVLEISWQDGSRKLHYGSPVALYADPTTTREQITRGERALVGTSPWDGVTLSTSSVELSGRETLYSPNGLASAGGGTLIADGDNARLVFVRDGRIVSSIDGINSPNSVVTANAGPIGPKRFVGALPEDGLVVDFGAFRDPDQDALFFRVTEAGMLGLTLGDGTALVAGRAYRIEDGLIIRRPLPTGPGEATQFDAPEPPLVLDLDIVDANGAALATTLHLGASDAPGWAPVGARHRAYLGDSGQLAPSFASDPEQDPLTYVLDAVPDGLELLLGDAVVTAGTRLSAGDYAALRYRFVDDRHGRYGDIVFSADDGRYGTADISIEAFRYRRTEILTDAGDAAGPATIRLDPQEIFGSDRAYILFRSSEQFSVRSTVGGRFSSASSALTTTSMTIDRPTDLRVLLKPGFDGAPLILDAFDGNGRRITLSYDFNPARDAVLPVPRGLDAWLHQGTATPLSKLLTILDDGAVSQTARVTLTDVNGAGTGGWFTIDGVRATGGSFSIGIGELGRVAFVAGAADERDVLRASISDGEAAGATTSWTVQSVVRAELHLSDLTPPLFLVVDDVDGRGQISSGWVYRNTLSLTGYAPGSYEVQFARSGQNMRSHLIEMLANGFVMSPDADRALPDVVLSAGVTGAARPAGVAIPNDSLATVAALTGGGIWRTPDGQPLVAGQKLRPEQAAALTFENGPGAAGGTRELQLSVRSDADGAPVIVRVRVDIVSPPEPRAADAWLREGSATPVAELFQLRASGQVESGLTIKLTDRSGPERGGYFTLDGARVAEGVLTVALQELARVGFVAGPTGTQDRILAEATDGFGQTGTAEAVVQAIRANQLEWPGLSTPIFVRITDAATGAQVFNAWHYQPVLDLDGLPFGSYLVDAATPGAPFRSEMIRVGPSGFTTAAEATEELADRSATVAALGLTPLHLDLPQGAIARIVALPGAGEVRTAQGRILRTGDLITPDMAGSVGYAPGNGSDTSPQHLLLEVFTGAGRGTSLRVDFSIDTPVDARALDGIFRPGSVTALQDMLQLRDAESAPGQLRVTLTDADGPGRGGHFTLDGQRVTTGSFAVTGAELGRVAFVAGGAGSRNLLGASITDTAGQTIEARWAVESTASVRLALPDSPSPFLLRIFNADTGALVFNAWHRSNSIELHQLQPGNYRASYWVSGQSVQSTEFRLLASGRVLPAADTAPTLQAMDGWFRPDSATPLAELIRVTDRESLPGDLRIGVTDLNGPNQGGYFAIDGVRVNASSFEVRAGDIGRVTFVAGAPVGTRDIVETVVTDLGGQTARARSVLESAGSTQLEWPGMTGPFLLRFVDLQSGATLYSAWHRSTTFDLSPYSPGSYRAFWARSGETSRSMDVQIGANGLTTPAAQDAPPQASGSNAWVRPGGSVALDAMLSVSDRETGAAGLTVRLTDGNGPGQGGWFTLDGARVTAATFTVAANQLGRVGFVGGAAGQSDMLSASVTDAAGQSARRDWTVDARSGFLFSLGDARPTLVRITHVETGSRVVDAWKYGETLDLGSLAPGSYRVAHAKSGEAFRSVDMSVLPSGSLLFPSDPVSGTPSLRVVAAAERTGASAFRTVSDNADLSAAARSLFGQADLVGQGDAPPAMADTIALRPLLFDSFDLP